jgi:hypothetical protein
LISFLLPWMSPLVLQFVDVAKHRPRRAMNAFTWMCIRWRHPYATEMERLGWTLELRNPASDRRS